MRTPLKILALLALTGWAAPLCAEEVYLAPETFIAQSFEGEPETKVLWLTRETKAEIRDVFGKEYPGLRIRYWREGGRTAWILEEIGKVKPITTGIVVEDDAIVELQVLIYRESHGWEVRYPFFTDQFRGVRLREADQLTREIDGISGATLSVNALTRLSRLALHLHRSVMEAR